MIDSAFVREHPDILEATLASRGVAISVSEIRALDDEVRAARYEIDEMRHSLKDQSTAAPDDAARVRLQELSRTIKEREAALEPLTKKRDDLYAQLPNINDPDMPLGASEADNVVVRTVGKRPEYDFNPAPYYDLPSVKPYILSQQGARVSGARFYYLAGPLVQLQKAIFRLVFDYVQTQGFVPIIPPLLVRERAMFGTGHFPADRFEVYHVNPEDDDLYLVGTAEVPLVSLHEAETISVEQLPRQYVAETTCFRREAGSYGKDQSGILRVHQFQKIEMVALTSPDASRAMHEKILNIEEAIVQMFDLHYQVVDICSGDSGFPASRKFDIEAWFPSQQKFRELTSTSNTTDFQSHRLGIHMRAGATRTLVHTVNGTAVTDRLLLALLEQHQQSDGSVVLPSILHDVLPWKKLSC